METPAQFEDKMCTRVRDREEAAAALVGDGHWQCEEKDEED